MKNIHVLPTDKPSTPSRLFYKDQELVFNKKYSVFNGVNIYITNSEEIRKGDWFLNTRSNAIGQHSGSRILLFKEDKKIILTTDVNLIKDGVQAIDGEFLEWFVKNPSCEEVEVNEMCYGALNGFSDAGYKIIIPSEEPKQDFPMQKLIDIMENDEELRPKQETLEEAAGSCAIKENRSSLYELGMKYFIEGAKWQQEKMYSEEEVVKLLIKFNQEIQEVENVREWFEEFKKK